MKFRAAALAVVLAGTSLTACGSRESHSYGEAKYIAFPGWEQVTVTGAIPGKKLALVDSNGDSVQEGIADANGALIFRNVAADRYTVQTVEERRRSTRSFPVTAAATLPSALLYDNQVIESDGFQYITMRDGTRLSINVALPGPIDKGPYPTVIEYSGYDVSNPANTTQATLFNTLGYAYVGVNMRGTGCSGGSFKFFEMMQRLDGYDTVEIIGRQEWVARRKVGLVGISYPGITQLFTAAIQPPHLAAISPLSVTDDFYRSTLYPGGILNTGFAVNWAKERMDQAKAYGQGWEKSRVDSGDTVCADNQLLRLQNQDLVAEIAAHPTYDPTFADEINPVTYVGDITVPVFIAGAWQDEQTGGRFVNMLDKFTKAPHLYAYLVNGLHSEALLSTEIFPRLIEFLDLYVARRTPSLAKARLIMNLVGNSVVGAKGSSLGEDRFAGMTPQQALAAYEAEPRVNVLFEEGAADRAAPGAASSRWKNSFPAYPIPGATTMSMYLNDADSLTTSAPAISAAHDTYTARPAATPTTFYAGTGADIWKATPAWNWVRNPVGTAATYTSGPLSQDMVVIGSSSARLWIRSHASSTDLEVTISEVRPDGQEMYVQSGWLRATNLSATNWSEATVEIFPFAHSFRKGSRLRINIDAPGGNRAEWTFASISNGEMVSVARDSGHPSRIELPIVSGIDVPAAYPTCTLRGQPCRSAK